MTPDTVNTLIYLRDLLLILVLGCLLALYVLARSRPVAVLGLALAAAALVVQIVLWAGT